MKVIKFTLASLHNEEWFSFYTDFIKVVERFGAESLKIIVLFLRLIALYEKADKLLVVLRKSFHTKEMKRYDKERTDLCRGLNDVVKGMQHQPSEDKQKAALRMNNLLKQYQKTTIRGTLTEKSSGIYNLLQDLNGSYADNVTLLGLNEWVTAIQEAENKYLNCRSQRTEESVDKPKEALKLIRREIDSVYREIVTSCDLKLSEDGLGGDVAFDPRDLDNHQHEDDVDNESHDLHGNINYNFVITWNETVKMYRNLVAQRKGRRSKGKIDEDAEPES
jgi:hypothetical protein